MAKNKTQQKHSSRKVGRNYRVRNQEKYILTGPVTRYRLMHAIPQGSRRANHASGICPLHKKATSPSG